VRRWLGRAALLAALLTSALGLVPVRAAVGARRDRPATHAASGPPLITGPSAPDELAASEEGAAGDQRQETDPLVANGLGSPLCSSAQVSQLSLASRRNCETSGFVAAAAPTNDYGLDVHINTGVLGLSSGGLLSAVQDLFIAPLWMALVWLVHALVVMLEWCFQIDLLDSATVGGVGSDLRAMQTVITQPWLAIVLPVAAVIVAYNGLVRRRIGEALGEALLMGVMMVGGMSVILDPTGTIGVLGRWANQASLGTLGVAASGSPAGTERTLADSMSSVFVAAIDAPWCYLEFGDVGWCREPSRLDPGLHAAALKIAAREQAQSGCDGQARDASCETRNGAEAVMLLHSAQLLRRAQTNGELFLALPANGPDRNSINEEGSLLRTLCQSSDATACRGPTAAEAEFRTNSGTWARVGGLLLILGGMAGMLLLLGFIALRLLTSAVFALLYLLLAPAAVLSPALGDRGRAIFRAWSERLFGAVVAKLLYSFLLGTILAVAGILVKLGALGWWTQWLLMSAFWWGAYVRRHRVLGLITVGISTGRVSAPPPGVRRVSEAMSVRRTATRAAGWVRGRWSEHGPEVARRTPSAGAARRRGRTLADEQARRSLRHEHESARRELARGPQTQAGLAHLRGRLARIRRERDRAGATGDIRRVFTLDARANRLADEISRRENDLRQARNLVAEGERAQRSAGRQHASEQQDRRAHLLDAQAALPAAGRRTADGQIREYAALAGLAGFGRDEYLSLDPIARRGARLQIDRELALRGELAATKRLSPSDGRLRASATGRAAEFPLRGDRDKDGHQPQPRSSAIMDDAREVAARRKRQLGIGRQ